MIDKFNFDSATASIVSKPSIEVNEFDAHLIIVKRSLEVLLAEPDEKTKSLAPYMLEYLPDHLDSLMEASIPNELTAAEKGKIGSGVYDLFADEEILERYGDHLEVMVDNWMDADPGIAAFWKWLNDKDAIGYLGKKDKEWLNNVNSSQNRNQGLLDPVAAMVAKHWLRKRDWGIAETFSWIFNFLEIV